MTNHSLDLQPTPVDTLKKTSSTTNVLQINIKVRKTLALPVGKQIHGDNRSVVDRCIATRFAWDRTSVHLFLIFVFEKA
jgi:hypothetical protein